MSKRPTLEEAKSKYVHRYTMEHVPQWAKKAHSHNELNKNVFYAPQYSSDKEWYDNTVFPEEGTEITYENSCYSTGQTFPLGQWLDTPYKRS